MIDYTLYFVFGFALGIVVAIFIYTAYLKKKKSTAKEVIDNAENQVEQIKKEKLTNCWTANFLATHYNVNILAVFGCSCNDWLHHVVRNWEAK